MARKCENCETKINYRNVRSLCDECLKKLNTKCIYCGEVFYNVKMLSKSRFLRKETCSSKCKYSFHKNLMLKNNPMKNNTIAKKSGETQKKNHKNNCCLWKEKYSKNKFKHWKSLSNGESVGRHQTHGINKSAVDFFLRMKTFLGFEKDDDYFGFNPYEFPLIISEKYRICFFPDYINKTKKIIIEWDEKYHKKKKQTEKDRRRSSLILNKYPDFRMIRLVEENFSNDEERLEFLKNNIIF